MKKILLLLIVISCLSFGVTQSAEVDGVFRVGSFFTYGEKSHTAYIVGGNIPLFESENGASVSQEFGFISVRGVFPEIAGQVSTTKMKKVLHKSDKGWNPFITAMTGFINVNKDGDDITRFLIGGEGGFSMFSTSVEIGLGVQMISVEGPGDQTFAYLMLDFNL